MHKLGTVYCSLLCIPEEYRSQFENIFLVQLHNTADHSTDNNNLVFSILIDQLSDLEKEGIIVNVCGVLRKERFAIFVMTGDNLGLHTALGFSKSFNSTYCCKL